MTFELKLAHDCICKSPWFWKVGANAILSKRRAALIPHRRCMSVCADTGPPKATESQTEPLSNQQSSLVCSQIFMHSKTKASFCNAIELPHVITELDLADRLVLLCGQWGIGATASCRPYSEPEAISTSIGDARLTMSISARQKDKECDDD